MAGVMTWMVDCFIRGFGVGVAASKLGVATSEIFEHFITNIRKKVKLASIANDRGGRASLKKRMFGLWRKVNELTNIRRIKKLSELNIQCSFRDGVIMFSLENNEPMVWPSPDERLKKRVLVALMNLPMDRLYIVVEKTRDLMAELEY
ncbi:hypothetical protein Gotur_024286 [Gossypium turneri]